MRFKSRSQLRLVDTDGREMRNIVQDAFERLHRRQSVSQIKKDWTNDVQKKKRKKDGGIEQKRRVVPRRNDLGKNFNQQNVLGLRIFSLNEKEKKKKEIEEGI